MKSKMKYLLPLIFVSLATYGAINWGNLTVKGNLSVAGTTDTALSTAGPVITDTNGLLSSEATLALTRGGTAKAITAVAGGVLWTDSDSAEVSAAGVAGQFLKSNATGAPTFNYLLSSQAASQTGTYAIAATDQYVPLNAAGGDFTATLPTAASMAGKEVVLKKTDSSLNIATIATTSSQTIDGSTTTTLNTPNETITVFSDGSNWQVRTRYIQSRWTAFTPTGAFDNTTYTGFWKRVGDTVYVRIHLAITGAITTANLTVNMPTGMTIDTAKLTSTDGGDVYLGTVLLSDTGTARYPGAVTYSSSSAVIVRSLSNDLPVRVLTVNATAPVTWASGDFISITFQVPVSGWK